jgi:hypothetical protein
VTTAWPGIDQRGPRRMMAIAYPAPKRPTSNQTSGWGVQPGKATAGVTGPRYSASTACNVASTTR